MVAPAPVSGNDTPTRRGFLARLLAGTAGLAAASALPVSARWLSTAPDASGAQQHDQLARAFRYVEAGVGVVDDWTILETREEGGAICIELSDGKRRLRVDVCRLDAGSGPLGVESTDHFDFFVMNEGGGAHATATAHATAAA